MSLEELVSNFVAVYLPAMVANGAPVVVMRRRRGTPIDLGKSFVDGKRLLGDGKTYEGLASGIAAGILASCLLALLARQLGAAPDDLVITGLFSSLGAMLGDLVKSFFKRRLGVDPGRPLPVADQLDFYLGATLLAEALAPVKPTLESFLLGLVVVPVLHVLTNYTAYKLGLKSVPW